MRKESHGKYKEVTNMVVQHNLQAMNSNRMLGLTQSTLSKSTEKLSSGYRVNRAADDAAGLAISEKMRRQIRGLTQASRNAQDGISMVQTAEGALNEVHDMLQRMNELAVQASNGTNVASQDKTYINLEVSQLIKEINDVANNTTFNGLSLLKASKTITLQIGSEKGHTLAISLFKLTASGLGVNNVKVSTSATATSAISTIKAAINTLNQKRAKLGAYQNRLEHKIANLDNVVENTTAAESRIRDTDMATEMVKYSNANILQQAGQSMLAQSNQSNQGVLSLLG
jgi:flagellin